MRFLDPLFVTFLDIFKKIHGRFLKKKNKLIFIREIPELQVDNEKVLSNRIRVPALSMRREAVVAEFSTFYAPRRFCAKISDDIYYSALLTVAQMMFSSGLQFQNLYFEQK